MSGMTHPMPRGGRARGLAISAWLTGIYFIVELGIGIWTGSVAVLSDAFHTFSAVGGVVLAIVASRLARRPANQAQTYGYGRTEILGAFLNGLFLLGMAIVVIWMGGMRLRHPVDLPTTPMLWAAAGGIATEAVSLWLLYRHQKGDLNVQGAFWHVIQTFVGSLIIILSALVIRFTGFLLIDPLLGMLFGFVLLWASWGIMRDSVTILLQGTPSDFDMNRALAEIRAMPGVSNLHHVHAWSLTSGRTVFSAHVCVDRWESAEDVRRAVHDLLRDRFSVYFSTIQVEQQCADREEAPEIDVLAVNERR